MDEAGQCNAAIALVPILRGNSLLLVGDTCQLKPVIVLDPINNRELKSKYRISDSYDYAENSILKMYYTNDTVSNIILLKNHYRCDPKIINFNNQKFYNRKLAIKSKQIEENPLVFVNVNSGRWSRKNTSIEECNYIIDYCKKNPNKKVGIITPFVNQRNIINDMLKLEEINLDNVTCGTIHEFQGDEKDTVIFSTAITSSTSSGTYKWLKNNKELFNVATSRARQKLIIVGNENSINALHDEKDDIFYELYSYVKKNGDMEVSFLKEIGNRALDLKPFSSELEKAFLDNLIQVIEVNYSTKIVYRKEVSAASIFNPSLTEKDLYYFYSCRFDFVLFDKQNDYPLLAIELCGPEHENNEIVIKRDNKKKEICKNHNFELVFVPNAYARRYGQLKQTMLSKIFKEEKNEIHFKSVDNNNIEKEKEELKKKEVELKVRQNAEQQAKKVAEEKARKEAEERKHLEEERQKAIQEFNIKIIEYINLYNSYVEEKKYMAAYEVLQNNPVPEIQKEVDIAKNENFKFGIFKNIKFKENYVLSSEVLIEKYSSK